MSNFFSTVLRRLRRLFGADHRPASETLLRLYISFQLTRAKAASSSGNALVSRCASLVTALDGARYAQDPHWIDAYEIERELLLSQSGQSLFQSLKMLLDRADAARAPSAKSIRLAYEAILAATAVGQPQGGQNATGGGSGTGASASTPAGPPPDALMLPLALSALEAVQWSQTKRFEAAPSKRSIVRRIVMSGLVACVFFVLPYVWLATAAANQRQVHEHDWSWLPLWTALTAGLLGAFFSRLLAVQQHFPDMSIDDIDRVGNWSSILLRFAVGMIGALVVLLFLQSELASSVMGDKLLPNFQDIAIERHPSHGASALPTPSLALLVVWCFVAGFSERIVPRILASAEDRLGTAATADGGAAKA